MTNKHGNDLYSWVEKNLNHLLVNSQDLHS